MMKKWCCILLIGFLLSGCSSKFAYNNMDWLVYWYLDDYVELNDSQEDIFDEHLKDWIQWHKSEELERYIQHLETVREDIRNKSMSEERVLWHLQQAREHWQRMREELSPQLAKFAERLSDEQVVSLFAALEEDNKEEEEELQEYREMSADERAEERLDDIRDDLEDRIGDLTDEQEQIIQAHSPLFMSTRADWIEYRRNIQQSARRLFVTRGSNEKFASDLLSLMVNPDAYRSEAYRTNRKANMKNYASLASKIAGTFTDEQRNKLLDEVDDFISDLRDMQSD
ncbi:DUF6279 family lipoprotein [Alteromonas halophila]|uniref:Lipoprotein n=1 Tax=Alteromonas halophila TaxID=516698 RepID=A0A918JMY3_9ALTE|nr:DUF6279 family lipoprotein [Alteromonas halophila]GGW88319.1 hypothetical protein GCM10007391_22790 [Alteromonas halophila]